MDGRRLTVAGELQVRAAAAGLLLALGASAGGAQVVHGTVVQADSTTRAAGIVVAASDVQGAVVARALSADDGAFDLRVPGAGRYTLRLLRIGYRPTTLPELTVPAEGLSGVRAVLAGEAMVLSAVTVRSDNVCGSTDDAGKVVAQLWESARTALTAAELSEGARSIDVEWQVFQFLMDRRGTRAQEQSVLPRRGSTEKPFVSVSADSLARGGYVMQEPTGDWVYRAPDGAALLSDRFAATHCFNVEPPSRDRPQWVGVAFKPIPARNSMRDITGTLWLDRASSELRLLEFRYTNLPPESTDPLIGGYVEYARLSTGHWIVARWAIRTPRMVGRTIGGSGVPGGGRRDVTVMQSIAVTGGEVIEVKRGGSVLFATDPTGRSRDDSPATVPAYPTLCGAGTRPGVAVLGTAANRGSAAAGASVSVSWATPSGTPVTVATVANERGAFVVPCIPQGTALTLNAAHGTERAGPTAFGPLRDARTVVDIDFGPVATRRP